MSLHTLSAKEIGEKFTSGELSAVEITNHFLDRIEKLDGQVGAYLHITKQRALEKARLVDAKKAKGDKLGPLAGIPVTLKDNMHHKGEPTTCASKILHGYIAPFDATVTRLVEEADGIILGKTNLDEFAMGSTTENSALKKTANPWNLECTPGGSSGGSAAAVAARMTPLAFGSDTGGSIRQPAAFCGVVGYKPTFGRNSRYGLVAFGSSFDQIGPFATRCSDIGLIQEVVGQPCPFDSTSIPDPADSICSQLDGNIQGLRVGIPWDVLEYLSDEARANFDRAVDKLKELGATVVDTSIKLLKYSIATYYILSTAEASTNLARFDGIKYGHRSSKAQTLDEVYDLSKQEGYGREVKRRIFLGTFVLSSGFQDAFYKKAQKVRRRMIDEYADNFTKCDVIAMPCTPTPAFPTGAIQDPLQMYLADIYTNGANLCGLPGISVPSGFNPEGKPFGLQILGPQRADTLVIKVADAYERVTNYTHELPEVAK